MFTARYDLHIAIQRNRPYLLAAGTLVPSEVCKDELFVTWKGPIKIKFERLCWYVHFVIRDF